MSRVLNPNLAAVAVAAVVGAAALSGCGSSTAAKGDAGGDESGATTTPAANAASPAEQYADVAEYVLGSGWKDQVGKPADSSASPIEIGWVGFEGTEGAALPNYRDVTDAAVKFVNGELGGIGGHPLKLTKCVMESPAAGQVCGQKMANSKSIVAVLEGNMATAEEPFFRTMAGAKPVIGFGSIGSSATAPNSWQLGGGPLVWQQDYANYMKSKGVKSAVQILPNIPALQSIAKMQKQAFANAGITSSAVFFPPDSTDVLPTVQTAGLPDKDGALILAGTAGQCTAIDQAMQQLAAAPKVVIGSPNCSALGDKGTPQWSYISQYPNTLAPYEPGSDVANYVSALNEYDPNADFDLNQSFSPTMFGNAMVLAKWMNEIGADKVTSKAVSEQARAFTGPVYLGPPKIQFGVEPFTAIGTSAARFYEYHGDGKWVDGTGGEWICATPTGEC